MRVGFALGCGVAMLTLSRLELLLIQPHGSPPLDPVIATQLALVAVGAVVCSLLHHRRRPYRVHARLAARDVDAVRAIRDWAWARDVRVQRLRVRRQRVDAVALGHNRMDEGNAGERWRNPVVAFFVLLGRALVLLGLPLLGGVIAATIWSDAPDPVRAAWDREGWVALAAILALMLTVIRCGAIRYTVALRGEQLQAWASRDDAEARDTLAFLVRLCEACAGRPSQAPRRGYACRALTLLPPSAGWAPAPPRMYDPEAQAAYAEDCRAWVALLARDVADEDLTSAATDTAVVVAGQRASLAERRLVSVLHSSGLPAETGVMVPTGSRHPDPLYAHYWPDAALRAPEYLLLVDVECDGPSHRATGRAEADGRRDGWLTGRGWYVARVTLAEAERGWPAAVATDLARLVRAHRAAYRIGSTIGQSDVRAFGR